MFSLLSCMLSFSESNVNCSKCNSFVFWKFPVYPICIMLIVITFQIAKFMGPTWGPPGSCRPQMGPMLVPWTLLSGLLAPVELFTGCWRHCSMYSIGTLCYCCSSVMSFILSHLVHDFQSFRICGKIVFRTLVLGAIPTNLGNQVKVGHALGQSHSVKSHGPGRVHQNNEMSRTVTDCQGSFGWIKLFHLLYKGVRQKQNPYWMASLILIFTLSFELRTHF